MEKKKKPMKHSKAANDLVALGADIKVPENKGAGRPTDYRKEYCKELIAHMAKGLSFESFAGAISTSERVLYTWAKEHKEFLQAKEEGTAKCRHFWEMLGVSGVSGQRPGFNSNGYNFQMKNRFKWTDRVEHSGHIKNDGLSDRISDLFQDPEAMKMARALAKKISGLDDEED